MDLADRLERLARLRETGALTPEEFAAAKAQALGQAPAAARIPPPGFAPESPARPIWPWIAGAVVLVLAVLGIGLLVGRDVGGAAAGNFTEARVENDTVANEAAIDEPLPTPTPSAPVADYAFASGPGVIGMTPELLESRLGVAESKAGGRWAYHVGGCAVSYTVRHDAVVAATMMVDATCHPMVDGTAVTERTTLGSLDGTYRADCLAQCRGGRAPALTLTTRGATFTAADAPLDAWAASLRGDDGFGADEEDGADRLTCVADPPADVAAQFAALTVTGVTIGREPGACRR